MMTEDNARALRAAGLPTGPVTYTPNQDRLETLRRLGVTVEEPVVRRIVKKCSNCKRRTTALVGKLCTSCDEVAQSYRPTGTTPDEVHELPAPSPATDSRVRDWARARGFRVGLKGPLPQAIRDAYAKANP